MKQRLSLPPQLLLALEENRALLFLGAGASQACGLPSSRALANTLADELVERARDADPAIVLDARASRDDLGRVASLYDSFFKGSRAKRRVAELIATAQRTANRSCLLPIRDLPTIREVITTNYDTLLEDILEPADTRVIARAEDLRQSSGPRLRILKLHGTLTDPESLVLTRLDYAQYRRSHGAITDLATTLIREKVLVLVGYSLEDANIRELFEEASADVPTIDHYFVSPDVTGLQLLDLPQRGFVHIPADATHFFAHVADAFARRHYREKTESFQTAAPVVVEPLHNPFVLYDTEALIHEKPEFLFNTFVKPVEFPTILQHQHTFIEGHRGSGKSTILWRLSLKARAFGPAVDLPMWGFYIKMVPGYFRAHRRPHNNDGVSTTTDAEWGRTFTHYWNLLVVAGLCDNLEDALSLNVLAATDTLGDACQRIATRILRLDNCPAAYDLKSLRRAIEEELDDIQNAPTSTRFCSGPTAITRCFELFTEAIPELDTKWWHLLLDEYDNVYPEQQAVINTLIRERHPRLRYKIAVKTLHAHLKDLEGHTLDPTDDFGYVSCDSIVWDKRLKPRYIAFLEEISNQRLDKAQHQGWTITKLLPQSDNYEYAGFNAFAVLSSGLTRQFLELCKDAVYEAFPSAAFSRVALQPIPPRIQNHVAKVHAAILFKSYRQTREPERVVSLFRVFGPLFNGIAAVTAHQNEPRTPLSFDLTDLDQLNRESLYVLEDAIRARLLQLPIIPKRPHNPFKEGPAQKYSFHRLLAPFFKLSLNESHTVTVSAQQLNSIWTTPDAVRDQLAATYKTKGISRHIESVLPLFNTINDEEIE